MGLRRYHALFRYPTGKLNQHWHNLVPVLLLRYKMVVETNVLFVLSPKQEGGAASRSVREIIEEVNYLHEIGYQEVVLTGVHLGGYGSDLNSSLLRIGPNSSQQYCSRVRLGSFGTLGFGRKLFTLWKNDRLCTHLHLPLQVVPTVFLKRMIRRCTVENYKKLVEQAKQISPLFHVSTDLIIGFPGETEAEFENTLGNNSRDSIWRHAFVYLLS